MKNRIHRMIDLPAFMGVCLILKFVVYYYLIKWSASSFLYVLISIVLTMGLYFALAKTRWKRKVIIFSLIYLGLSIFMFADVMYFNYYNQTVSIEQFWQLKNVAKVPQSFVATIIPISIFILLDIPVVIHHFMSHCKKIAIQYSPMGSYKMIRAVAVVLLFVVVATNPFGNARLAKVAGEEFFLNHVNDVIVNTIGKLTDEEVEAEEVMKMIAEIGRAHV